MIPTHRPPTSAGEMLLEKYLKPMGMTQMEAARRMAMPLNRLNEIVHGKRGISADSALRLSNLLGTTLEFWMNLQAATDLYRASQKRELAHR